MKRLTRGLPIIGVIPVDVITGTHHFQAETAEGTDQAHGVTNGGVSAKFTI